MPVYEDFIQRGGAIRIRDFSNNDTIVLHASSGTVDIGTNEFTDLSGNGYTLNVDGSANATALYEGGIRIEDKYALKQETSSGTVSGDYLPLTGGILTGDLSVEAHMVSDTFSARETAYVRNGIAIGYTPPPQTYTYMLDISGDINFTGSLYQNGILFDGSGTSGSGDLYDPDFFTVTSEGNVGIGVASPTATLHVDKNITGDLPTRIHILAKSDTYAGMGVMSERTSTNIGGYQFFKHDGTRTAQIRGTVDGGLCFDVDMNTGNDAMVIRPNKSVGIGTSSPTSTLEVVTSGNGISSRHNTSTNSKCMFGAIQLGGFYDMFNQDNGNVVKIRSYSAGGVSGWIGNGTTFGYFGIRTTTPQYHLDVNGTVRGSSYTTSSDRRIKEAIQDLSDNECLTLVRQLKPVKYRYIDKKNRGTDTVYGFIAQDIRDTIPYATDIVHAILPDYYADVSNIQYDTSYISFDISTTYEVSIHQRIKVEVSYVDILKEQTNLYLLETRVLDICDNRITIENELTHMNKEYAITSIFFYGSEVNDFHTVKKDAIWTIATSALQELDRQQVAHAEQIQTLTQQLLSLEQRVNQLETT